MRTRPARRRVLAGLAAGAMAPAFGAAVSAAAAAEPPRVAAAINVQAALERIAAAFRRETGVAPRITYGSSGNFVRQIAQGAPFELFLSADEGFARALAERGLAEDAGAVYAVGRLALVARADANVPVDPALAGLAAAIADGRVRKLAIANPELAPYGQAAVAALVRAGLAERARPLLVMGENVGQATQFVLTGSAEAGLVPQAVLRTPALAGRLKGALVPEDWHAPLRQRMVLVKGAGAAARRFYSFVLGAEAGEIFAAFGYARPAP